MEEWIRNLVLNFREEYKNLSKLERTKVSNLDDLKPPLQIEIICIKNQRAGIEHQLFIFTHFEDREDLEIKIHEIESQEAIEKLEQILKDEKWQRKLPKDSHYVIKDEARNKFATILEGFFVNMLQDFKGHILNSAFSKPKDFPPGILGKTYLTKDSFSWEAKGDVRRKEAKEIVSKMIEEAKKSALVQPKASSPVPRPTRIKGHGTYFYPPIWIGKIPPQPNFKERILESGFPLPPQKSFDTEYQGYKVVVNENGFIAIGNEDRNQALTMLNSIMATALLLDTPFFAVRDLDLGPAEIDQKKLTISSYGVQSTTLRATLFGEESMPNKEYGYIYRIRKEMSKEELIKIIRQAEVLAKESMISEFLLYLLESHTYLENSEYNQSFVMSWIILEKYLSFRWKSFLQEKGITSKLLENLIIDKVLRVLHSSKLITEEQFKSYMDMKDKRNSFIHRGKGISKKTTEKCFKVSSSVIELLQSTIGERSPTCAQGFM